MNTFEEIIDLPQSRLMAPEQPTEAIDGAAQEVLVLERLIRARGRNSANAWACLAKTNDFSMGLEDLRSILSQADAGDPSAVNRIPALLDAFRRALNFEEMLSSMKAYRKNGETALAEYIQTTITTLSSAFNRINEAVRPLCSGFEVSRITDEVRSQVQAALGYRFHSSQKIVSLENPINEEPLSLTPQQRLPDAVSQVLPQRPTLQVIPGGRPRNPAPSEPGFLQKLRRSSAGMALALAACFSPESTTPPAIPILELPPLPPVATQPVEVSPAASPFLAYVPTQASNVWTSLETTMDATCPALSDAQVQLETGKWVEKGGLTSAAYKEIVEKMKSEGGDALLNHVRADIAQYGWKIPASYGEVLDSTSLTRQVAAYYMDAEKIKEDAVATVTALTACPA